ncbi:MAG: hypothetical protein ACE5JB_01100 [bacterium]
MRIGEIAILGPAKKIKQDFIKAVCDEIVIQTDKLIFGRLLIDNQLVVHLYGLEISEKELSFAWDLVSKKLLGYVVLFNWNNSESLSSVKSIIDFMTSRYNIPLVIAANLEKDSEPIPEEFIDVDFHISEQSQFTFCRLSKPESVKKVLIILINSVIALLN